jgi:hypothetical protein
MPVVRRFHGSGFIRFWLAERRAATRRFAFKGRPSHGGPARGGDLEPRRLGAERGDPASAPGSEISATGFVEPYPGRAWCAHLPSGASLTRSSATSDPGAIGTCARTIVHRQPAIEALSGRLAASIWRGDVTFSSPFRHLFIRDACGWLPCPAEKGQTARGESPCICGLLPSPAERERRDSNPRPPA